MMVLISAIVLAISLCADCFAVSICSSVTLKKVNLRQVLPISVVFGIIQALLMIFGCTFGDLFIGYVQKAANIIGFLLLLYVGGSMIIEAIDSKQEVRNLNGLKNVILGAVATSIDAFVVGVSLAMDGIDTKGLWINVVAVFVVTILSVIAGMFGGSKLGCKFGKTAELIGGIVLILIGLNILVGLV